MRDKNWKILKIGDWVSFKGVHTGKIRMGKITSFEELDPFGEIARASSVGADRKRELIVKNAIEILSDEQALLLQLLQ